MVRRRFFSAVSNHEDVHLILRDAAKTPLLRMRFGDWCCLERQRLDKWLWHARVVKARASAAALVEAGHVRVNGAREKAPGHSVKIGDVVTIGLDRTVRVLKVVGFSERRGDASAARVLYDDLQARPE
jgi:ribosome-associated heat shock protein Hsp15